jgi:hypothetical protein
MRHARIEIEPARKERGAQQHARPLRLCLFARGRRRVLSRQRPKEPREMLVRTVYASAPGALARNDDVGHSVVGQVRTHLACAYARVGEYDHARSAAITPCERIVPPDGFEFRKHLGVAVARGVRRELEREARGEAVQPWRDESRRVWMVRVEVCGQCRWDRRGGEDKVKWIVER